MRVCVAGAGAIGGWVAAKLAIAGNEVMALTSRGPVERLQIHEGSDCETVRLSRFKAPAQLLVLAVKAPGLSAAAPTLEPLIDSETIIVPMLNGVPWWLDRKSTRLNSSHS